MARRGTDARKEINEFRDGLQSLRNVCLRSFPEFLADVKMASMGKGGELGTTLADFVVSVRVFVVILHTNAHRSTDCQVSGPHTRGAERRGRCVSYAR